MEFIYENLMIFLIFAEFSGHQQFLAKAVEFIESK
jgi:hypothetical protein